MREQRAAAVGRRGRAGVGAALALVLAVGGALAVTVAPVESASAMTQIGSVPAAFPGQAADRPATVQNQVAGTGTWTITAPPNTRITSAQSRAGAGLGQFTCAPSADGSSADCGTSTWGAGNQVDIALTADAGAPGGQYAGTSTIAGPGGVLESSTYRVAVQDVPFVDRLTCAVSDATMTSVFSKTSQGLYTKAVAGADLGLATTAAPAPRHRSPARSTSATSRPRSAGSAARRWTAGCSRPAPPSGPCPPVVR